MKAIQCEKGGVSEKRVFIVCFSTMDSRDRISEGAYFFYNKSVIMKPWSSDMDFEKDEITSPPILVQVKV